MASASTRQPQEALAKIIFESLARSLSEATGATWTAAESKDAGVPIDDSAAIRVKLSFGGSLQGDAHIECHRASVAALASEMRGEPVAEHDEALAGALQDLLETAINKFGDSLLEEYREITVASSSSSELAVVRDRPYKATLVGRSDSERAPVFLYLDATLAEALSYYSKQNAQYWESDTSEREEGSAAALPPMGNLNLVMDVELNVTLRFGKRQLSLREVLELTTGSVIELDRQVEEPVELLLDGKVIAKGEAVVVDGNYGLRVVEVCQPVFYPGLGSM
jgi:flagellar motor switch protein FliN/FliY